MDKLHAKLEELLKAIRGESRAVWPSVAGGVQQHPEPVKHPGDNKEAISTVKPGSKDTPYVAEGEPHVHHVKIKKYDHEKGMPATPVAKPKASIKEMGANKKPIRASRHRSSMEVARNTSGMETTRPGMSEHTVHEPETKKGETCAMTKHGQWSIK